MGGNGWPTGVVASIPIEEERLFFSKDGSSA
jgi:hypothetical protein